MVLAAAATAIGLVMSPTAVHADAQRCPANATEMISDAHRFTDQGDGTVTDSRVRLQWMRCAAGQTWQAGACTGSPKAMTWTQAQQHAIGINASGAFFYNDWRLPNIRELALITQQHCRNPRIDDRVFPQTPSAPFWTSVMRSVQGFAPHAFTLDFGDKGIDHSDQESLHYVRLVRQRD